MKAIPTQAFTTSSADEFEESIAVVTGQVSVRPNTHSPFHAEVNLAKLPRLGLFKAEFSECFVTAEPMEYLSLTVPLSRGLVAADWKGETFEPGMAHIANIDRPFAVSPLAGLRVLVANFDRSLLCSYRTKLNGGEASGELEFCPRLSATTPEGASLWRYLSFVWGEIRRGSTLLSAPVVAREIKDSLIAMFLYATTSGCPDRRQSSASDPGRVYLNRAEDYMLAHLSDPVSIGDVAAVAGVSVRTLKRAFKKRHSMGPIAFLKERRLEAAQRMLLASVPESTTVTEVALSYGFNHLGQFSADFRKAFQELPSETLRR